MATHIYTSVAVNYLPKARVLAESIKKFHPDWTIHLVLCDAKPEWFSLRGEPFDSLITLEELEIPNLPAWKFEHDLVELSTAVKGFALRKILALPGCTEAFYFDPDIVVLSSLSPLLSEFERASILLTPHLTEPETAQEAIIDNELSALRHGIYNLGFAGVRNSEEGRRFAGWWCNRLQEFCYDNIPSGLFTDQRWADLVPAYFTDHKIVRDEAYNVATWNLTHRTVTGSLRNGLLVNGKPLAFYHFSGFDSGSQQEMLNKYGSTMPALFELREWYLETCERHGQKQLSQVPWSFGFFDNGERILPIHRKRYREGTELQVRFPNPYATEPEDQSYLHWFQWHGESRLPLCESVDLPLSGIAPPPYRIFLIGAPGDAEYIPESVSHLQTASFQHSQIFLVVNQHFEIRFTLPENWEVLRFDSNRYEDLFAAVVGGYGETDMLIVRAGIVPPRNWDLRLAWSAARHPSSVLTVSPLDRRIVDPAGVFSDFGIEKLDEWCYWFRQRDDPETASFLEDCVYLRVAALREIANAGEPVRPLDLVARAARSRCSHRLATHVCCAWHPPRRKSETSVDLTGDWHLRQLRDAIRSHAFLPQITSVPVVSRTMTGPTLHVMHSWGGGVEQWLEDYSRADREHENLVLKSFGHRGAYGNELRLYRYGNNQPELLRTWPLEPAIPSTAAFHKAYKEILAEIYREFRFERAFISSLIGHALECLRLKLPTTLVCHDYYPFCSAINITFGEVCRSCEKPRLQTCLEENVHNRFFPNVGAEEWLMLRTEFLSAVRESEATFVAPSPSVRENYSRLLPELASSFVVIPHGTDQGLWQFQKLQFLPERPLRVLVVGSLHVHKGRLLLESILPDLLQFADVTLLGCYDFADTFIENAQVRVIPNYEREELPKLVAELEPEINLLLSVVPETFSYILRELQYMGVPCLATRLGSFADWIEDGVTGFLCAPAPKAFIETLRNFARDKRPLASVHQNLQTLQPRSTEDMVRDYARLTPTRYSPERYFYGPRPPEPVWERRLQLYWSTSETGFSEENSFTAVPLGIARQLLRLYFPGQRRQPLRELRLDLSAHPGFLLLHQVSLLNSEDEMVWNWNGALTYWEAIRSTQVFPIKSAGADSGTLLYLTGDDPFLILPMPSALLEGMERGGSVTVDFMIGTDSDYTPDLIAAQLQAIIEVNSLRENLARVQSEHNRLSAELEKSEAERAVLKDSVSWQVTKPVRAVAKLGRKVLKRPS